MNNILQKEENKINIPQIPAMNINQENENNQQQIPANINNEINKIHLLVILILIKII